VPTETPNVGASATRGQLASHPEALGATAAEPPTQLIIAHAFATSAGLDGRARKFTPPKLETAPAEPPPRLQRPRPTTALELAGHDLSSKGRAPKAPRPVDEAPAVSAKT